MNSISLKETAGISIFLSETSGEMSFGDEIITIKPNIRRISDVKHFYIDSSKSQSDVPLYLMYRGVCLKKDFDRIANNKLRYDITVLLPGTIANEYIKTIGHVHPLSPFSNYNHTFTEVYSVIYGQAMYILQKFSHLYLCGREEKSTKMVEDIIIVEAKPGDIIFIPSHYGHTTVNVGDCPLVMANILYSGFNSLYEPYRKLKGASYYVTKGKANSPVISENQMYYKPMKARFLQPSMLIVPNIISNLPLYWQFLSKIEELDFLYK